MKKYLALAGLAAFCMASARAEVVSTHQEITTSFIFKWGASYGPSPASMTISLNDNGTMNAFLDAPDELKWTSIGLDSGASGVNYFSNISNFSGNGSVNARPVNTPQTPMNTGLVCSPYCTGSASWAFGNVGQFSSYTVLMNGGHTWWQNFGPVPAYLQTTTAQYYQWWTPIQVDKPRALPTPSSVPEPTSISLAGAGLMAIALLHRRSRRRA